MSGFLHSLITRVGVLGGDQIFGKHSRLVGIKFRDVSDAIGFVEHAHDATLWHDYMPSDARLLRSDSLVMIQWPDSFDPGTTGDTGGGTDGTGDGTDGTGDGTDGTGDGTDGTGDGT